mgnify:CR=1 FL=1
MSIRVSRIGKLEKACSGAGRPTLAEPYLRITETTTGKGKTRKVERAGVLHATDSYIAVSIVVPVDDDETEGIVPLAALAFARTLKNASERRFDNEGRVTYAHYAEKVYHFDEDPKSFKVLPGRPSQLRRGALISQIRLRRQLGLPTADFELEWQNKLAYPIAGFAAGLVALALSLRRNRKGHLTVALVESVAVSLLFWIAQAVCWSLGLSGRISPEVAAWAPNLIFVTFGAAGLRLYA